MRWAGAFIIFFFLIFITSAEAHPGRTAADGCHYCRTNCDYWGVPWNQRHCHGEPIPTKIQTVTPTRIPTPTITPTDAPTATPTPTRTPVSTMTPAPTDTLVPAYNPQLTQEEEKKTEESFWRKLIRFLFGV